MSCFPPFQVPPADPPLLAIVGPTAVGKSALAVHLALRFNGEIISADSRQIYRSMDIGTAKPSPEDRQQVRHHLIDILDPRQEFSLAEFLELAHEAIQDVHTNRKLPIVTGGTGQYVWALLEGWQVPHVPPNIQLRQELQETAAREGAGALYQKLCDVDPEIASTIDQRNLRRLIRVLEIYHGTGMPPSTLRQKQQPPYSPLIIGLTMEREALYRTIDRRVDQMVENGLVEEVRSLIDMGCSPSLPCMSSMGYKETFLYLKSELTLEEATRRIKHGTHRFARHQYAWFRPGDPRICWLQASRGVFQTAEGLVHAFLREGSGRGTIASTSEEKPQ